MEDNKSKTMFTNWSQSTLCLEKTKTAFHKWVIQKWKELLTGYNDSTIRQFLKHLKYVPQGVLFMPCGEKQCDEILKTLKKQERIPGCLVINDGLKEHIRHIRKEAKKYPFVTYRRKEGDELSEEKYIWCLANMFMQSGKGQKAITTDGPDDTDVSLFFKMMRDCKMFRFDGCDELYENILEVRKEIHHSATYLFTNDQKSNCLNQMIRFLEAFPTDESRRSAISQIKEMKESTMGIASVSDSDPETEFKEIAKVALKRQKKSLVAEIEIDKAKGYTTDEKEQKLKDTKKAMKNLDGQYGLKSRKELKQKNQELLEELKLEKLRKRILELKKEKEGPTSVRRCAFPLWN